MKLQSEDVDILKDYSSIKFKKWLYQIIDFYYNECHNDRGEIPCQDMIGLNGSLTRDIAAIYRAFELDDTKNEFKIGLQLALVSVENLELANLYIKQMLNIGCAIKAYEILTILPEIIGSGLAGEYRGCDDRNDELFIVMLETVATLSTKAGGLAEKCLKQLVGSINFREEYSDVAFLALSRTNPKKFPQHLDWLRRSLTNLFKGFNISNIQKRNLTIRFLNCLDLQTISENITNCQFNARNDGLISDKWFIKALFDKEGFDEINPVLGFKTGRDQDEIVIFRYGDPNGISALLSIDVRKNRSSSSWLKQYFLMNSPKKVDNLIPSDSTIRSISKYVSRLESTSVLKEEYPVEDDKIHEGRLELV